MAIQGDIGWWLLIVGSEFSGGKEVLASGADKPVFGSVEICVESCVECCVDSWWLSLLRAMCWSVGIGVTGKSVEILVGSGGSMPCA